MLAGELFGSHRRDRSLLRVALAYVELVSDEHQYDFGFGVVLHLVNPFLNVLERLLLCNIVNE